MPQSVSSIHLDSLSVDPTSPVEGQLWYNSTDKKLRKVINGLTEEVQLVSSAHKTSVRITTTSSIANLSNTTVTISGVTCVAGDRVLVQNNASRDGIEAVAASHNGVYTVGTVTAGMAAFTRSSDANTAAKLAGMTVLCQSCGTYHALALAASAITLETTALNFVSVASKAHSNGTVTIDSNGISVGSITDAQVATANKDGTAGTVSLRTLGTGAAQACAGNDARLSDDRTGSGLRTASTVVAVSSATAPTSGQVLTATSGTAATWQNSAGGSPTGAAGGDLGGTYPNPAVVQASGAFAFTGVLSPASIGAHQNDYNPTSLATASIVRLTSSGTYNITGLAGGAAGRIIILHNIGANVLNLTDEDAASTASNRFALRGLLDIEPDRAIFLQYDSTSSRWRTTSPLVDDPYGTAVNTICQGNDARLTDDRTGAGLRSATTVVSVSSATAPTSGQVLTATSGTAATWQTSGGTAYPRYSFGAPDFDTPNSSDWTINAAGALAQDSVNSGLSVIRFDDTTEEGVGFTIYVPSGVTNLTFRFVSRAQTAPGGAVTVRPVIYVRESVDNSTVEAWSSATLMTAVDIPTNANYQYDSQTIALSTLSMVAGRVAQLELTRRGTDASDTLTGDWNLLQLVVELT